jgi:hypothetical protein
MTIIQHWIALFISSFPIPNPRYASSINSESISPVRSLHKELTQNPTIDHQPDHSPDRPSAGFWNHRQITDAVFKALFLKYSAKCSDLSA